MYDLSQRKYIFQPKVKDLIAVLEGENPEAILTVDGLDEFFIHTTEDMDVVTIDLTDLESDYIHDYERNDKEYPKNISEETLKRFKIDYGISRIECLRLLGIIADNLSNDDLIKYGFTEEQIKFIRGE